MRFVQAVRLVLAGVAVSLCTATAGAAVLASCAFNTGVGDGLDRGFYVSLFGGNTVDTVTLAHRSPVPGRRTIELTMRLNAYNGPVLGVATADVDVGTTMAPTIFNFNGVAVPPGFLLAFSQRVTGGNESVTYNVGTGTCTSITQTEGTTPPLDAFRRATVGLMITGSSVDLTDVTTFGCPFDPANATEPIEGDGFVVERYPGTSLRRVIVQLQTNTFAIQSVEMVARLDRFDGPLVGTAIAILDPAMPALSTAFNFGNLPVPGGARLTFKMRLLSGGGAIEYDTGFGPCSSIYRVDDTSVPPIPSDFRSVGVSITGDVGSTTPIPAVEYYHAGFGHYFMTAQADEIAGLDGGAYGGAFARTGREFDVFDGPVNGAIPVCRFFTVTFAPKSSHFYTADAGECEIVNENPNWQYEKIAFFIRRYDGACPAGQVPVYRLYNSGLTGAPNHRYTTDLALYGTFVNTQGWAAEGIKFCAVP